MKVLIISHMYPNSINPISGIFIHQLTKSMVNVGVKVKVVVPVPAAAFPIKYLSKKWIQYSKIPLKIQYEGIEIYHPRYLEFPAGVHFESSGERMYYGVKNKVREICNDFEPDLIHAHVALPDGVAAMRLSEKLGIPFIVTIHGQDLNYTIFKNKNCFKKIKQVFAKSSRMSMVSNKLARVAKEKIGYDDKITVIGNGVDLTDVKNTNNTVKNDDSFTLLSVSNLVQTKGIDLNLRAMEQLVQQYPNIKYIIAGDGTEKTNLMKMVSELNLTEHVHFLGRVEHQDVMKLMNECDLFVLPSWQEGFGVVYIEAMAHGKVVIGCKGEGIDGVIQDGINGFLVERKNVDQIVSRVKEMIEQPEHREQIGEKARSLVFESYTWGHIAQRYIEIYHQVCTK